MKIKRSQLLQIVKEEMVRHLGGLLEANDHEVVDADDDHSKKDAKASKDIKDKKSIPSDHKKPEPSNKELPGDNEESDDDLEKDISSPESDLEADANGSGIGDQIRGLSILSFTVEPQPKTGKTELVLQFKESPNPLRIVVMPGGNVMFAYKGAMTKSLGEE